MDFVKNLIINLTATGPAVVVIVWLACVTVLGVFGSSLLAWFAMVVLNCGGAFFVFIFGRKIFTNHREPEINPRGNSES